MIKTIARVAYEADRAAAERDQENPGWGLTNGSCPPWREAPRVLREAVCDDVEAVLAGQDHPDPAFVAIVREMAAEDDDDVSSLD